MAHVPLELVQGEDHLCFQAPKGDVIVTFAEEVDSLPLPPISTSGECDDMAKGVCSPSEPFSTVPNPSLRVTPEHTISISPAPVNSPQAGEVLIHVRATGICGSDVHFWKSGCIGSLVVEGGYILGHEAAGVVMQIGDGVQNVNPGDRVAIEPGVPCGNCFICQDGRYNLCEDVAFAGVYPHDGTIQRLKCHAAKWVHKLPDDMTYAQGALLEPLSVVLHGIASCKTNIFGQPVLVQGAGPVGLIALAVARASGAHPVVICDVEPKRLDFAKDFVPGCLTYLVQRDMDASQNADEIRALFGVGKRGAKGVSQNEHSAPATVLECTGVESSVAAAAFSCRIGGTVMVIGVGRPVMNNLPFMHMSLAEVSASTTAVSLLQC
jgi:L-iditol 2-dehydrogenase